MSKNTIQVDPNIHTKRGLKLVLLRAQQWECSPAEAIKRLIDEAAAEQEANKKKEADASQQEDKTQPTA